ncbi:hypothetical protein ASPZODRAFT_20347 [Penicilliopsis zonata CBS 506.65]|uniref:Uncharacterized protein n=1 Tax=Penicilliopsis zonata CBS 506.65 TaxID=1073090 RepID=A0A1L9S627_9EURO|nr:hypothetical protein ASPZODRAFT_20347 [Penicilliopsis zonata CBS 506.65]OJJ42580.1 hypothetical protein ASPZODRAFT_20347 [Penicilliopsis zonata CBS 506.65]
MYIQQLEALDLPVTPLSGPWQGPVTAIATMGTCTPSYFNAEGDISRGTPWGTGVNDFNQILHDWRAQGEMDGLEQLSA